jgi:hypothetical protein
MFYVELFQPRMAPHLTLSTTRVTTSPRVGNHIHMHGHTIYMPLERQHEMRNKLAMPPGSRLR